MYLYLLKTNESNLYIKRNYVPIVKNRNNISYMLQVLFNVLYSTTVDNWMQFCQLEETFLVVYVCAYNAKRKFQDLVLCIEYDTVLANYRAL